MSKSSRPEYLDVLPPDIWSAIFLHLPVQSLPSVMSTCRAFHLYADDEDSWHARVLQATGQDASLGTVPTWKEYLRNHLGLGTLFKSKWVCEWSDVYGDDVFLEQHRVHKRGFKTWNPHIFHFKGQSVFTWRMKGGGSNWEFHYFIYRIPERVLLAMNATDEFCNDVQAGKIFMLSIFRVHASPSWFEGLVGATAPRDHLKAYQKQLPYLQRDPDFVKLVDKAVTEDADIPKSAHKCDGAQRCLTAHAVQLDDDHFDG